MAMADEAGQEEDMSTPMSLERKVLLICNQCQRVVMSDGTQRGGKPFCKHAYAPIPSSAPSNGEPTDAPQPPSPMSNASSTASFNIAKGGVMPTLQESYALHEVQHNLFETQDFISEFEQNTQDLGDALDKCKKALEDEFKRLQDILIARKKELIEELNARYNEREEKLFRQISALQEHETRANECRETYQTLINTMNTRKDLKERQEKIIATCRELIESKPQVSAVPIDLEFRFAMQTSVSQNLQSYGRLKFTDYNSGERKEYTAADSTINPLQQPTRSQQTQPRRGNNAKNVQNNYLNKQNIQNNGVQGGAVGAAAAAAGRHNFVEEAGELDGMQGMQGMQGMHGQQAKKMVLPVIKRLFVKCREGQLKLEPNVRNPDFAETPIIDGVDEKEFNSYMETNVFLQVECVGNQSKDKLTNDDFEKAVKRHQDCLKLPPPDKSGKISILLPTELFENLMIVHARSRFVYVHDAQSVAGGNLDARDIVTSSEWSADKPAAFKAVAGAAHKCTFRGDGAGAGAGASAEEEKFIPPPADVAAEEPEFGFGSGNGAFSPVMGGGGTPGAGGGRGGARGAGAAPELESVANGNEADVEPMRVAGKRIKLKIDLILKGQKPQSKQFPFKDEFSFENLLTKTRQRARIENGQFEFALKENGKQKITNNREFINFCVEQEPDPKGYNAHIVATQVD